MDISINYCFLSKLSTDQSYPLFPTNLDFMDLEKVWQGRKERSGWIYSAICFVGDQTELTKLYTAKNLECPIELIVCSFPTRSYQT